MLLQKGTEGAKSRSKIVLDMVERSGCLEKSTRLKYFHGRYPPR